MAEKKVIELEVKTDSVKSLKAQLREAQADVQQLSEKFGATSQEAVNAAKRAAELKDAIGDAKALTDAFNPDAKFNALSASIGGVLNGFQAYEGALGLIGVESEALQETMLKVQSAMALSQGLQGLLEAKDSFKQLGAVASNALKGIKTGLLATGIGALVVALGTIIAYWDDIKELVSGVSAEQQKLNEKSHENYETAKEQLSTLDAQDNILKLQGKSEREILNIKIKKIDSALALGKIELENVIKTSKAEEAAAIQNYNMTKKIVDFLLNVAFMMPKLMLMPIDMAIKGANKVSEALGLGKAISFDLGKTIADMQNKASGFVAGSIFNVPALKKENEETRKEIEKSINDLENQKAGFQLSIKQIDQQAAKDARTRREEEQNKIKEEQQKLFEEEQRLNEERLKKQEEAYNLELSLMKDTRQKEIQELINSYDEKYELANGNAELEKQLTETLNSEIAVINKKYADEEAAKKEALRQKELNSEKGFLEARITQNANDYEARLELLELNRQAELSNKELTEGEIAAIEAKYAEERKKISDEEKEHKKKNQDLTLEAATTTLDTIANVAQLFAGKSEKQQKKAFNIQKAASIANATIQTYQSATSAFSSLAPIPIVGPVLGAIAAAGAVAAGIMNIKKIASTKFEGGGAPSGGGGAGASAGVGASATSGGAVTPQFNVVGNAQATNPLAGLGNQPIQAYVVSGEVTTAQQLDNNKITYATFG